MTPASSHFELRWDQAEDTKSFWLHQLADFAVSAIGGLGGTTDFNTIIAVWDKQTEAVAHRVKAPANDGGWFWASIQRDLPVCQGVVRPVVVLSVCGASMDLIDDDVAVCR